MDSETPEYIDSAVNGSTLSKPKGTTKKRIVKKSKSPLSDSFERRREEIWGVIIMLLSTLFLIALFCYNREDEAVIENISLLQFFTENARVAASHLNNPLGLIGAKLSSFLIQSIFGYPTSILLVISAFWGWSLFRREGYSKAIYSTVYGVLFTTFLASLFGLTELSFSQPMSGAIGMLVATSFSTILGKFGAWCFFIVLTLLIVALFIDLDIQKTFDRIAYITRDKATELASGAKLKFNEWRESQEKETDTLMSEAPFSNIEDEANNAIGGKVDQNEENQINSFNNHSQSVNAHLRRRKEDTIENQNAPDQNKFDTKPAIPSLEQTVIHSPHETIGLNSLLHETKHTELSNPSTQRALSNGDTLHNEINSPTQHHQSNPSLSFTSKESDTVSEHGRSSPSTSVEDLVDKELEKLLNGFKDDPEKISGETINELQHGLQHDISADPSNNQFTYDLSSARKLEKTQEENDEVLDALLNEITTPKKGNDLKQAPSEPEITVKEGVQEKEADLDERELEVETKEHFRYQFPSVELLNEPEPESDSVSLEELEENKRKLLEKLRIYKIDVVKVEATVGPRVTLFELELAPDVKVSRITSLADDLAMAMSARGIRIIAPIPGKNAVGVEIPNMKSKMVSIKTLLQSEKFKNFKGILPIAFGKTISNEIYIDDLAKMPHLLVAGATGSGKSVGINTILTSLIYFCSPEKVKFLLIDPKRVELFPYQKLKNHFLVKYKDLEEQIITDTSKAVYALKSVEKEMDMRYDKLAKVGVRNIKDFNAKYPEEEMPYIVVVIDELADMMITAGRDVEEPIARLAQLARAVGIHLVVATQRPSVDVITGVIKANFPARIAYQVASKIDSRTILDMMGAEQLLGLGDMLYLPSSEPKPIRIQNAFVSTEEVEAITEFLYAQKGFDIALELPSPDLKLSSSKGDMDDEDQTDQERDKMFVEAAKMVVRHQQGSVSLLQRRLKLGFGRAARIMDQLEQAGIVGAPDGSKPREVLIESEESLGLILNNLP